MIKCMEFVLSFKIIVYFLTQKRDRYHIECKLPFTLEATVSFTSEDFYSVSFLFFNGAMMGPTLMSNKVFSFRGARLWHKKNQLFQQKKPLKWLWTGMFNFCRDRPVVIAVVLFPVCSAVLYLCTDRWPILLQSYCECSKKSKNSAVGWKTHSPSIKVLTAERRKMVFNFLLISSDCFWMSLEALRLSVKIHAKTTAKNWSNEAFYLTAVYKYIISLRFLFWCKLLSILLFLSCMLPSSQLCSPARRLSCWGVFIS